MNTFEKLKIKLCHSISDWESDLSEFNYSIFQTPQWIETISKQNSLSPVYIDIFYKNKKSGKISGIVKKNKYTGKQIYFYSGPAIKDPDINLYTGTIRALKKYLKREKYTRLNFGSYGCLFAPEVKIRSFHPVMRKEYIVNLESPDYHKNYSRNIRRNIKKGKELYPELAINNITIEEIKRLLESTRQYRLNHDKKEYHPLPLPYFNNYNTLNTLLKTEITSTYSISIKGQIAGFLLTLEKHPYASALLTGIDMNFYSSGLSPCLYDQVFTELHNKGFHYINLGGIPDGEEGGKLAHFKKSLGAKEVILYGASSDFLIYPYKLLNPGINIIRKLPKDHPAVKFFMRFI